MAEPYYIFAEAGFKVTIGSPAGGAVPIDANSVKGDVFNATAKRFMHDGDAIAALSHSVKLSAEMASEFECVYLAGGHGCCVDFVGPKAVALVAIVEQMYAAGKVVAADCHGPMGLLECKKADGTALVAGLEVTAFTNVEEVQAGAMDWVVANSRLPETAFIELGATFVKGEPWSSFVAVAGNLVTAQNPQSGEACAHKVVELLKL